MGYIEMVAQLLQPKLLSLLESRTTETVTTPTTKVASPPGPAIISGKGTVGGKEVLQDDGSSLIQVRMKLLEGDDFILGGRGRRGRPEAKAGELLLCDREGVGDDGEGVHEGGGEFTRLPCSGHDGAGRDVRSFDVCTRTDLNTLKTRNGAHNIY